MMLQYERDVLHAKVNTMLGTLLLASVALWSSTVIYKTATDQSLLVQAFTTIIAQQTQQ